MVALVVRLLLVVIVVGLAFFIIKSFLSTADAVRCSRCEGKGFWYGARGKEKCDWCKGSGRLNREKH
jgi:DnaJ-class molecular chaperone